MKQICHPEELRKALEAANLLQHIENIPGELQKQENGTWLPVCEILFKPDIDGPTKANVNIIFQQQVERDWPTIIENERQRLAAMDEDNKEGILFQLAKMDNAEYNTWWNNRTAAQKDAILKRILRIIVRGYT